MFDKRITESDRFIDLPNSTKALYFMAGMSADDRGFFQPKTLQRMCGFTDDDYKILIAKNYFMAFESGVMVITDWNKNNWLDSRRLTETEYVDELKMLSLINDKYELNIGAVGAKQTLSNGLASIEENSIEENRVEENSIEEGSREEEKADAFVTTYTTYCTKLPQIRTLTDKRRRAISTFKKTYKLDDWEEICRKANNSDFLTGNNDRHWRADFDFLINVNNAVKVLEDKYYSRKKVATFADLEKELLNDESGNINDIKDTTSVVCEVLPEY